MKSLILALTLINASPEEQDLMLADMYDADPRLAYEVLDVADELGRGEPLRGVMADPVIDSMYITTDQATAIGREDSTKNPDVSGWNYPKDDTVMDLMKTFAVPRQLPF